MTQEMTSRAGQILADADVLILGTAEPDPLELNRLAYEAGVAALDVKTEMTLHEMRRKPLQLRVRDELIGTPGPDGKPLSRTAAEAEARTDDRYLSHVAEGEALQRACERLELVREMARQRAWLQMEVWKLEAENTPALDAAR